MKREYVLLFVVLSIALPGASWSRSVQKSRVADQIAVEVTVYNNNLGLVKDVRKVKLGKGEGELRFMDVAAHIMPVTVHAVSLNDPDDLSILEQNYEYDLISSNKLLDKYVGKKIKIIDWNRYQDRKDTVEAVLLSNNGDQIYRIDNEIYLGHPGYKVLPKLPENLIAKPTLTWLYENRTQEAHDLEVSYLTTNISWKADYIMVLGREDTSADISGWVTLDNSSGATYRDAKLKLVAGEVHRVQDRPEVMMELKAARRGLASAPQFREKDFFEYHIYDLQRKTTIKDKQTKQVNLLEAGQVKVMKELLVYGVKGYFSRKYTGQHVRPPVSVYIEFKNAEENNLGIPFPAGIMRLYKEDDDGSLQFIGEDGIDHTPRDEKIRVRIGEAFDVVAERKQTAFRQITTSLHESEWEITLRNHKKKDIRVGVVEPLYGNWKILKNSHPFKKQDAFTLRFDVSVPKDGEVAVTYGVRVGL